MLKTKIVAGKSGKEFLSYDGWKDLPILTVTTYGAVNGSFNTATRSGAGTTTVVEAYSNDAIVITDLILTTDKVNGATATVQITDGVNTIVLISADLTDAPCNIAISFAGHWEGWQGAYIDLVTTGAVTATLALGYFRIPWNRSLIYEAWDARR